MYGSNASNGYNKSGTSYADAELRLLITVTPTVATAPANPFSKKARRVFGEVESIYNNNKSSMGIYEALVSI